MVKHRFDPEPYLPLTPPMFQLLLALADGDKHGYAIISGRRRSCPATARRLRSVPGRGPRASRRSDMTRTFSVAPLDPTTFAATQAVPGLQKLPLNEILGRS